MDQFPHNEFVSIPVPDALKSVAGGSQTSRIKNTPYGEVFHTVPGGSGESMNIDRQLLDACDIVVGPAISLAHGLERSRVLTLSPFAVPMEHGIALLKTPAGTAVFHGLSMSSLTVGIPQYVMDYLQGRLKREHNDGWNVIAYDLSLTIVRDSHCWVARLGQRNLCEFQVEHINGVATPVNIQLVDDFGVINVGGFTAHLAALIARGL